MKKRIIVLSLLLSIFILPAAAIETGITAGIGVDAGLTRTFMTENVSFNAKIGPFGIDGGIRLVENFKKSTNLNSQVLFIEPNARVFLGNFYLGYGFIVNQKGVAMNDIQNSVFSSGFVFDVLDLKEAGKLSVDSCLEFSSFGIYIEDDADGGETLATIFEFLFNMLKIGVSVTYTFPL